MTDAEFRMLMITLVAGLGIAAVGTLLLFLAFRAFGSQKKGSIKHILLGAAALAFILVCCLALVFWAVR